MTANKMPVLPEAFIRHDEGWAGLVLVDVYTADQMRAMWLAGVAAARECVPAEIDSKLAAAINFNACRDQALANLSALEQGVGK